MERRSDRVIRWLLPSLGGLLILLAYAFTLFLRKGGLFAGDGDPGRHIRVGSFIIENRAIPRVDVFSHTMQGREFIPFEWLSEVLFSAADSLAGLAGVAILTGLLFATAVGLTYQAIRRFGVPAPVACAFGVLAFLLQAVHLHPRPHMFTTALVALFSLLLLEVRRGGSRRLLLTLPVLMVAWVNLHGGFLVGFILVGIFAGDALVRWMQTRTSSDARELTLWLIGTLGLCLLASLLNPAGWALWPHTTGYLGETYLVDFTQEYKSPDFHDTLIKSFLAALTLGTIVLAQLRTRVDLLGLFLWVLFAAFALHSARNIPLFGVVCMPWLAAWTSELLSREDDADSIGAKFWNWSWGIQRVESTLPGWPVVVIGLALLTVGAVREGRSGAYAFAQDVFPVEAVDHLQESGFVPPGPVYNEFIWGGYLLYAWPEVPVFIDGQTDFYGEELTREYRDIRFLQPGWRESLASRGVEWVLVPPDSPLAAALTLLEDWALHYSDETAAVFVSVEPGTS
ncbi:MAG: hypothetical protein M8861_07290 [marine benthic group bacterium]|nr:hypothetical protein [Gemmatimonadota bacterium]